MRRLIVLILVLLIGVLLTGCNEDKQGEVVFTATPSDSDEAQRCFGFDPDTDVIVSDNYCLDVGWTVDAHNSIIQAVPDSFSLINKLENVDGYADDGTAPARIECDDYSCQIQVHDSVTGIDGLWGYEQTIAVDPGCYLIKVSGHSWVNDPKIRHELNYTISAYIDDQQVGEDVYRTQGTLEAIFPVMVEATQQITYSVMIGVSWATPGHNSYIDLIGLGLLAVPDDYCLAN